MYDNQLQPNSDYSEEINRNEIKQRKHTTNNSLKITTKWMVKLKRAY